MFLPDILICKEKNRNIEQKHIFYFLFYILILFLTLLLAVRISLLFIN